MTLDLIFFLFPSEETFDRGSPIHAGTTQQELSRCKGPSVANLPTICCGKVHEQQRWHATTYCWETRTCLVAHYICLEQRAAWVHQTFQRTRSKVSRNFDGNDIVSKLILSSFFITFVLKNDFIKHFKEKESKWVIDCFQCNPARKSNRVAKGFNQVWRYQNLTGFQSGLTV